MDIFIINYIENFFILWFALACFRIGIFKIRFLFLVGISTLCALIIQQLHLFNNIAIDPIINLIFGIIFYAYFIKINYWKYINVLTCFKYLTIYFIVFVIAIELFIANIYYPIFDSYFIDDTVKLFLIFIPYRLIQVFTILIIQKRRGIRIC